MLNVLARCMVALIFVLVVGVPGFARAMPTGTASGMKNSCCVQACNGPQSLGNLNQKHVAQCCLARACVSAVSLPTGPVANVAIRYVSAPYSPLILLRLVGVHDVPDAPPPKPFALS